MKKKTPPTVSSAKAKTPRPAGRGRVSTAASSSCPVVGVGASAGGLEAFTQLLQGLPVDTGMAFVLVQHLDPDHESALTQLLTRATSMPLCDVTNDLPVAPNHVYVIPPNFKLIIAEGVLKLRPRDRSLGGQRSIDIFFESLAQDQHARAIGVVLSGTATDGTEGLEAIKAEGGITFAQDKSARYDSMPRSAVEAGCVDFVLPAREIGKELARIARHPCMSGAAWTPAPARPAAGGRPKGGAPGGRPAHAPRSSSVVADSETKGEAAREDGLQSILLLLRKQSGVDFALHKTDSVRRRVVRRMVLNHKATIDEYAVFLRDNALELGALYSDMLIGVTSFFRDPDAFALLQRKVFPQLIQRGGDGPIRVWVVGCSTGQEAYSIAMAYLESTTRAVRAPRLQVFATDLNDAVLAKARAGLYLKSLTHGLSPERLGRFFVEEDGCYRVSKELREMCVFARQDVLSDPPFSRLDLITCRNLLIYIEPAAQKRIFPLLHHALKPGGFLFLGATETVGSFTILFEATARHHNIFSRKPGPTPSFRPAAAHSPQSSETPTPSRTGPAGSGSGTRPEHTPQREADRVTLRQFSPPGVLIDSEMQVLQFRGPTGAYLEPPSGKASFHVLKMAREGLALPLRAAITKARQENTTVYKENVRVSRRGDARMVNIEVIPLKNLEENCCLILFKPPEVRGSARAPLSSQPATPRTPPATPASGRTVVDSARLAEATRRVAELERELSESRDWLQSIQEQHEVDQEELSASNDEVQSANEELQSINEELETSKDELETSKEELQSTNQELANRNAELGRLNSDLNNLHLSINTPILLLTRDLAIRRFTPAAAALFNLLAADQGRALGATRRNFDCPDLDKLVREVIDTVSLREREVQDKEGRWYSLRARPYLTPENKVDGAVLMLVDINALKRGEQRTKQAHDYAEAILRTARDSLIVLRADLRVDRANDAFYTTFHVSPGETEGRLIYELSHGQWNIPKLRGLLEDILPRNSFFNDFEVTRDFDQAGRRAFLLNARRLDSEDGLPERILLSISDITERLQSQAALRVSEVRYRRLFEAARDGILLLDPTTRKITDVNAFMTEFLGYTRAEFLGKELWEIGLLKDEQASQDAFAKLQQEHFIRYDDLPLETRSGDRKEAEFVSNLYQENGHQVIQCNIRDITDRKRAQQALLAAKNELSMRAGQLEETVVERTAQLRGTIGELEAFSYSVSHDLRSPLRAMQGFARILLAEHSARLDPEGVSYLERISSAANRMDGLIQDVLAYTQGLGPDAKIEPINVDALVRQVIASYPQLHLAGAEIKIDGVLPKVLGNDASLTQCFSNLLTNAVKFVAPGATPRVRVWAEAIDADVRLWVEDNGIGIELKDQERIFKMLERVPSATPYEGTGMGLAIVRKAAERMGGTAGLESELGHGSRFWIQFRKGTDG